MDLHMHMTGSYVKSGSRVGIRFIPFHLDDDDIWPNFENPSASSLVIGGGRSTAFRLPPSSLSALRAVVFGLFKGLVFAYDTQCCSLLGHEVGNFV